MANRQTELISYANKMERFNVNMYHPANVRYETFLEIIDFDEMRKAGLISNRDFLVFGTSGNLAKDFTAPHAIFSPDFGTTNLDTDGYIKRYSCKCGHTVGKIHRAIVEDEEDYNTYENGGVVSLQSNHNHINDDMAKACPNIKCEICGTEVNYKPDNYKICGWSVLHDKSILHLALFPSLQVIFGKDKLASMLQFKEILDENGLPQEKKNDSGENKYAGIGITAFISRLREILNHAKKSKKMTKTKLDQIKFIEENIDKLTQQSILVYSSLLRPSVKNGNNELLISGHNKYYSHITKNVDTINNASKSRLYNQKRIIENALTDIQYKLDELRTNMIDSHLGRKNGEVRRTMSNRFMKTGRAVIVPDYSLRVDQVRLPYNILVVLFDQNIINILSKSYGLTISQAYERWFCSQLKFDEIVLKILKGLTDRGEGIPVAICRNPSIAFGSTMQMYCVGINMDYTMSLPLQILPTFNADFDGDCMNILAFLNDEFLHRCERTINPRNTFFISRDDGDFNNQFNHARDSIVLSNSLVNLVRDKYTEEEMEAINNICGGIYD